MSIATWVGVGLLGGIGAMVRFRLDGAVQSRVAGEFPLGTLVVNLSGAFCLGILTGASVTGTWLLLAGTGFLGSYTTFSTWMLETERLGEEGSDRIAAANLAVSIAGGSSRRSRAGWSERRCEPRLAQAHGPLRRGERFGHHLLSDALMDAFDDHGLRAAVLIRAAEGFGLGQTMRTDRLLTLSEDLPLVAVAVDDRAAIERASRG